MITEITRNLIALTTTRDQDRTLCCGLAIPQQIGPRTAALFLNTRPVRAPGIDFEDGGEILVFDDLSHLDAVNSVRFNRNETGINPNTGEPCILIRFYPWGGFVPLGALRPDGSPHPHAGTGFSLSFVQSFPLLGAHAVDSVFVQPGRYEAWEISQLAYDGTTFRVLARQEYAADAVMPDMEITTTGMTNAIPDGDDLLTPIAAHRRGTWPGCGLMRWRRGQEGWQPIDFSAVTGSDRPYQSEGSREWTWPGANYNVRVLDQEPSCVRDTDGSLLFTCRRFSLEWPSDESSFSSIVWRSTDGRAWERLFEIERLHAAAPLAIGQAGDGTPYIAANLYTGAIVCKEYPGAKDGLFHAGAGREVMSLWPLSPDRRGLEPSFTLRDARADFGPPPSGLHWRLDHPIGGMVRLKDGRWRSLIAYRGIEEGEYFQAMPPTPYTGTYLEEILFDGDVVAPWKFADDDLKAFAIIRSHSVCVPTTKDK